MLFALVLLMRLLAVLLSLLWTALVFKGVVLVLLFFSLT